MNLSALVIGLPIPSQRHRVKSGRKENPGDWPGLLSVWALLGFAGFHAVHRLLGCCLGLILSHHFHARCH
jgi:hypothetical protein